MNDENEVLLEIKIKGQDYTSIAKCLSDCSVEYSKNIYSKKKEEWTVEEKEIREKINDLFYLNPDKGRIGHEKNFKDIIKFKDIIIEELKQNKKNSILSEVKNIIDELKMLTFEISKNGEFIIKDAPYLLREKLKALFNEDKVDKMVTIFDNETWDKAVASKVNNHPLILLYKQFAQDIDLIENEELIVGRRYEREIELKENDCCLYICYNNNHMFGNLVGTICKDYTVKEFVEIYKDCLGDKFGSFIQLLSNDSFSGKIIRITVQIRSRLDGSSDKPYFLLEMLTKGNIRFSNKINIPSSNDNDTLFDCLLLWKLKQYLMKAYRKGVFRSYNTFYRNDNRLKGTIDFAAHIKNNLGLNNGNIAYTYREKSVDNYLNHLILEAYEELKLKYRDIVFQNFDNQFETKEIIDLLKNETNYPKYNRSMLMKKCETPILHPYYTEYEELRKVCMSVLRGESISIMSGADEAVSGILYYIPDLWEEYLESRLEDMYMSSQEVIDVLCNGKEYRNQFRPDYVFSTGDERPFMILDAKYKPRWMAVHKTSKLGDHKQDFVECIRNMNAINAYATGVIFPYIDETEDSEDCDESDNMINIDNIRMHAISEYNQLTSFYTIPIAIPVTGKQNGSKKFEVWKKQLDKSINKKIECMKKFINLEEEKFKKLDALLKTDILKKYEEDRNKVEGLTIQKISNS